AELGEETEHRPAAPAVLVVTLPEVGREQGTGGGVSAVALQESIDRGRGAGQDLESDQGGAAGSAGGGAADQPAEDGGDLPRAVELPAHQQGRRDLRFAGDRVAAGDRRSERGRRSRGAAGEQQAEGQQPGLSSPAR